MPLYRVHLLVGETYEAVVRAPSLEAAKEFGWHADPASEGWDSGEADREVEVVPIEETAVASGETILDTEEDDNDD